MTIESATYISDLNAANPGATDIIPEGDDHLRLLKTVLKNTLTTDGSGNVSTTKNLTGAALIPSGATIPTNGIYLKAANNPALSSNTTLRWDVSSTGNHTLAAPTSGNTLALSQLAGGAALTATDGTTSLTTILSAGLFFGTSSNHSVNLRSNNIDRVSITGTGNVSIAAPSAGSSTLNIIGSAAIAPVNINAGAAAASLLQWQIASVTKGYIGTDGGGIVGGGTGNSFGFRSEADLILLSGAGAFTTRYNSTGNWTTPAPSSGDTSNFGQVAGYSAVITSVSLSGGIAQWAIANTSNTASSDARQTITAAGSSAGDAYTFYSISGVTNWGVGVDNSDSDTFKIDSAGSPTTSTNRFNVTTDGRIYGNALHNNAGAVTGTTNQYIASGTYTPTLTNTTNVASSSASFASQWVRVGNVVTVSGTVSITPTAGSGTATRLSLSLPIASNLGTGDLAGTAYALANASATQMSGQLNGDGVADKAILDYYATSVVGFTWTFIFTYLVS